MWTQKCGTTFEMLKFRDFKQSIDTNHEIKSIYSDEFNSHNLFLILLSQVLTPPIGVNSMKNKQGAIKTLSYTRKIHIPVLFAKKQKIKRQLYQSVGFPRRSWYYQMKIFFCLQLTSLQTEQNVYFFKSVQRMLVQQR